MDTLNVLGVVVLCISVVLFLRVTGFATLFCSHKWVPTKRRCWGIEADQECSKCGELRADLPDV
jgi:hypothetical protein